MSTFEKFSSYSLHVLMISLVIGSVKILHAEQESQQEFNKARTSHYALLSKFALEPEEIKQDPQEQDLKENQEKIESFVLSKHKKQRVVYNLLAHNGRLKHTTDVITPEMWQEWNIINSQLSGPDLLHAIDNTQTIFGNVVLARLLSEPKVNRELIEKRQNFIKLLIEDKILFNLSCDL